jgi:phosphotransferase system HPr-like phosphotransfer protein
MSRADAVAAVDMVVARIQSEYEIHARAIAALVQEADTADMTVTSVNNEIFRGASYEGLQLVGPRALRLDGEISLSAYFWLDNIVAANRHVRWRRGCRSLA